MPKRPVAAVALMALLALTSCAAPAQGGAPSAQPQSAAAPITIDNCGTEVTFTKPPERVITIKSTSTEMLLALGLGDKIVGTASADGPVPERWAAGKAPVLSDSLPSQESVLAKNPDLVYAGWESNFSNEGAGERESLQKFGINSLISSAACQEPEYQPDPLTFEGVFGEITQTGEIFGVPAAAQKLVAEQKRELADITPSPDGLTALWYSSGSDTPYVGAGIGAPQMLMGAAGLKNIAADVHDTWAPLSWEAVADRNPDVIILADSTWSSVTKKINVLEANPVTAKLDAVRNSRYLILPFAASEAGVRNVSAVASLVDQLEKMHAGN